MRDLNSVIDYFLVFKMSSDYTIIADYLTRNIQYFKFFIAAIENDKVNENLIIFRANILSRYNDLVAMSLRVINEVDPADDKDNCIAKTAHAVPQLEQLKNRFIEVIDARINAGPSV